MRDAAHLRVARFVSAGTTSTVAERPKLFRSATSPVASFKKCLTILIFSIASVFFLVACTPTELTDPQTIAEYYSVVDSSCASDADCVIKDLGNCCGALPQCVNKNSYVNASLLSILCAQEEAFGVCGFEDISACTCVDQECVGS